MPDFKAPEYPELLTVKNWNKNKGFWAKIVGDTGVTELLKACEKAFEAVHWDRFDFCKLLKLEVNPDASTLDGLRKQAEKELSPIKKIESAADKVEERAREVHEEFKENKVIRKSSTAHVKEVADEAKEFSKAMSAKAINRFLEIEFAYAEGDLKREKESQVKSLKAMHVALDASEAKMKTVKTRQDFEKYYDACLNAVAREFGELFQLVPGLKDYHKEFLRTCGQGKWPADDEVAERLTRIAALLKNIRKKLTEFEKAK